MWAWKAALLFLAVGATAYQNPAWKYGTRYQYELRGRSLASLHQVSNQYSGILIRAGVTLQPIPPPYNALYAQLSSPSYAPIQDHLNEGWDSKIPEDQLDWQDLPISSRQFMVNINDSKVIGLAVDEKSETWEDNIVKAIVSLLQVDTSGAKKLNDVYEKREDTVTGEFNVTYQLSELPEYALITNPELAPRRKVNETIINIEKSINFDKARQRIEYHSGYTGDESWKHVSSTKRSSVSRIVVTGDLQDHTIQSSVTKNKLILQLFPYNEQSGMVVSLMNLTLTDIVSEQPTPDIISLTKNYTDLIYNYENAFGYEKDAWSKKSKYNSDEGSSSSSSSSEEQGKSSSSEEGSSSSSSSSSEAQQSQERSNTLRHSYSSSRYIPIRRVNASEEQDKYQQMPGLKNPPNVPFLPFFVGNKGQALNRNGGIDDVQIAKKLSKDIEKALEFHDDDMTLVRFSRLVNVIRIMNESHIQKVNKELQGRDIAREIYRDAVAEAGTGPALSVLSQWVINGVITGQEAAQRFAVLPRTALIPNAQYMQLFFNTTRHPKVLRQKQLHQDMILAFTELLRQVQVDKVREHEKYPVHTFGSLTPRNNTDLEYIYIPYVEQRLMTSLKERDRKMVQTYIRALQSVGHKRALKTLQYYLENKSQMTKFERLLIVSAMDPISELHPEKARIPLLKLYQDANEPHEIRCAAVLQIMKTKPPKHILQEMAETTNQELDNHVVSIIKSAIQSASQLQSNYSGDIRSSAKAAVNLLNPQPISLLHSHVSFRDGASRELGLSYKQILSSIASDKSLIPSALFFTLRRAYQDEDQYHAMVSDVNSLIEQLQEKIANASRSSSEDSSSKENSQEVPQSKSRKLAQGNVMFSLFGQPKRFIPFDVDDLVKIALYGNASIPDLLKHGGHWNFTKFYNQLEVNVGFPSAMGVPAIYELTTPTLFHVSVSLNATNKVKKPSSTEPLFNVSGHAHIKYSSKLDVQIGIVTPFDGKKYVAGIKQVASVSVPVNATVAYESEKTRLSANLTLSEPQKNHSILSYSNEPYTSQVNILSLEPEKQNSYNYSTIHVRQPKTLLNETFGKDSTGMVFRLLYQSEKEYNESSTLLHEDKMNDPLLMAYYPLAEKSIQAWNFSVDFNETLSTATKVKLTATIGSANFTSSRDQSYWQKSVEEEEDFKHIIKNSFKSMIFKSGSRISRSSGRLPNPADPKDKSPDSKDRREQFLKVAGDSLRGVSAGVIDLAAEFDGRNEATYVATFASATSPIAQKANAVLFAQKSFLGSTEPGEICLTVSSYNSQSPIINLTKAIESKPKSYVAAQLDFGKNCKTEATASIEAGFDRSVERRQFVEESPMTQVCRDEMEEGDNALPACLNATKSATKMDRMNMTVQYQNIPQSVQNATYYAYSWARQIWFQYIDENVFSGQGPEGEIVLKSRMSPDLQSLDVSVQSPLGSAQFNEIPVSSALQDYLTLSPEAVPPKVYDYLAEMKYGPMCTVGASHLNTFDNVSRSVEQDSSWCVMAKYTQKPQKQQQPNRRSRSEEQYEDEQEPDQQETQSNNITVFARNSDEGLKEVLVERGQKNVSLRYQDGRFVVEINGEQIEVSKDQVTRQYQEQNGQNWLTLYVRMDDVLYVEYPQEGINVLYDGMTIALRVSHSYRGQLRGLCGKYTGNPVNDIKNQTVTSCDPSEEVDTSSEEDESDIKPTDSPLSTAACSSIRTRVYDESDQTCFSVRPQPTCQEGCRASKHYKKNLPVHCVKHGKAAENLVRRVVKGYNPDLSRKPTTKTIRVDLPQKCVPN